MAKQQQITDYQKFLMGIAAVMAEHNVTDVLVISDVNGDLRNSYLNTGAEKTIFTFLSDGVDAWVKQAENT